MLMECLIEREGPTRVTLDKFDYDFMPQPKITGGDEKAKVAFVNSTEHQERLLGTGMYRHYIEKKPELATTPAEKTKADDDKTGPLTKETFFLLRNVAQVKSAIRHCTDRALLDEIGQSEHTRPGRRQWAIDALNDRLRELTEA